LKTSALAIPDVSASHDNGTFAEQQSAGLAVLHSLGGVQLIAVLPAHNEAGSITQTVWSLQTQTRPPDRIIVVCDNCTDETADLALLAGAEVMTTIGNTHKKAGALNQALARLLPYMPDTDQVLVMDADSSLNSEWLEEAARALDRRRSAGAVCGVFLGEPGAGVVGQIQRNEYIRYARQVARRRQVPVLSGTGTLFRVSSLRQIAAERGTRLPGIAGEFYSSQSITEDDEITLAMKTLGHRCVAVEGCETTTEVMPTLRDLWKQRLRWQKGALSDLRGYGLSAVTSVYWLRQATIYFGLFASITCWAIMGSAFTSHPGFDVAWTAAILGINFAERLWTVRKAGRAGMLVSALMVPEFAYDAWRMGVFLRAIWDEIRRHEIAWGHLGEST
jgi:poly-beta-1,6-N-acetyl-D-glucosamine synthase